jgi:hypothetical protein
MRIHQEPIAKDSLCKTKCPINTLQNAADLIEERKT